MLLPQFNFQKRHFQKLATKSQKHVLVKISSMKISYNIYNIYNSNLRNDAQSDKLLDGGNLFTTPFNYISEKI